MLKTKLPKGMIFENVAKLGNKPNWNLDKSIDWFRLRYEGLASLRDACRS